MVDETLSLGEYLRRMRRGAKLLLQDVARETGISISHLSRIENDNAVPDADAVVKLANVYGADLNTMLEKADCLPREILERLTRRASQGASAYRRQAGDEGADPDFASALVQDMDPQLRAALATKFDLSEDDAFELFRALQQLSEMTPDVRDVAIRAIAGIASEGPSLR